MTEILQESVLLQQGDLFEIIANDVVYTEIPYLYKGKWQPPAEREVVVAEKGDVDTHYLKGQYVVLRTAEDGGGMNFDGAFPDGHHIWAQKVDADNPVRIDFYQTGCFTAMVPDRMPIGKAEIEISVKNI